MPLFAVIWRKPINGRSWHLTRRKMGTPSERGIGVWLYTLADKGGHSRKLATQWHGPCTIVDKTSSVNYRIQLIGTAHQTVVHWNHLKPEFETPELASCGSKPLCATSIRVSPAPNSSHPTYANVVKGSVSPSEPSAVLTLPVKRLPCHWLCCQIIMAPTKRSAHQIVLTATAILKNVVVHPSCIESCKDAISGRRVI